MFAFSLLVPSQLILEYAYMLDVLIHHIVHMKYIDNTLPILRNFEKIFFVKKLINFIQVFSAQIVFLKVLENYYYQNIPCGQYDVCFFVFFLNLNQVLSSSSVHMPSAAPTP